MATPITSFRKPYSDLSDLRKSWIRKTVMEALGMKNEWSVKRYLDKNVEDLTEKEKSMLILIFEMAQNVRTIEELEKMTWKDIEAAQLAV